MRLGCGRIPRLGLRAVLGVVFYVEFIPRRLLYTHVSDVLYFGGVRPKIDGGLRDISRGSTQLSTLKSHAAANGFRLHMSMFEVYDPASSNDYNLVWNTIAPALRCAPRSSTT